MTRGIQPGYRNIRYILRIDTEIRYVDSAARGVCNRHVYPQEVLCNTLLTEGYYLIYGDEK